MKLSRMFGLACTCLVAFAATSNAQNKTIVETAVGADDFNTLVAAVKAAGLVDTLNGHKQFTVFAPTDAAFAALPAGTLETLLRPENKQQLIDILTYHVVAGRVNAKDAFDLDYAKTVNGQRISLNFKGSPLAVNESNIAAADINCSNGVIHVIDKVLLPTSDRIPDVAKQASKFNTLLAAVGAAGLGDVLGSDGPFTVFAPTDEAFAALPEGTVESLLQPKNKNKLVDILKYHVVSGRVYSSDAVKAERAPTLLGPEVRVSLAADGARINDSRLVSADIDTANGVIHVIDAVLLPKMPTATEAKAMIQDAVSRGAPIYNSGHHRQCCDIYMSTLKSMMSTGIEGADDHLMKTIRTSLKDAKRTQNSSERAWALRRGMEAVYTRLNSMPMSTSAGS